MAFRINHNIPALNALRNLNRTDDDMSRSLERLSSGLKVNRGSDGPAVLVISEQMRGQIASIGQALQNSEASISMVQTAEASLTEVNRLLVAMRQLAIHAANEGANDARMLAADQAEVDNSLDTIDRIALTSQFGTRTLFDGSNGPNGVAVGNGLEYIGSAPTTKGSHPSGYAVEILQLATRAEKLAQRPIMIEDLRTSDGALARNFSITISEGGKHITFSGDNPADSRVLTGLLSKLDRQSEFFSREGIAEELRNFIAVRLQQLADNAGLKVEVQITRSPEPGATMPNGGGLLFVQHREYGATPTFSVSATVPGILASEADRIEVAVSGRDVEGTIDGKIGVGKGQLLTAQENTDAAGLMVKFHSTRQFQTRLPRQVPNPETGRPMANPEIKELARMVPPVPMAKPISRKEEGDDFVFTWEVPADISDKPEGFIHLTQNSLSFQVGPTRGHQVKISLVDAKTNQLATGISNVSGFRSLRNIDVRDPQGAQDALLLIDDAMAEISTVRADLGAFQKNILESNANSLRISRENLTAAESSLRDADMAEEMSQFTRNQIMLASGVAMLAQANQTPQAVLQLLRAPSQ